MVEQELLDVLACPKCRGGIDYDKKKNKLTCRTCRLRFPIIDNDIPDMLIDDAEKY